MSSPVTRVNRPKSKKGAVRAATSVERRPWSRHPGEGETTDPGPDPARWGGRPPDACPAGDDPAHHREAKGTLIHTDEYDIYARLENWGYGHKTVCHAHGEYARDDDGDGFCEVHVNSIEGFWSLLRSWLRPHRGIAQEKLPAYLGFFQFIHNARQRGKALLGALIAALVT